MDTEQHKAAEWVVVGVDGSPEAEVAVRYAVAEAERRRAGVRLVHVMPVFPWGVGPGAFRSSAPTPIGRSLLSAATRVVREVSDVVPMETRLLVGDRRDAILTVLADAVEIVIGHDPDPSLRRLATGSTLIGVAARAPLPVVAVAPRRTGERRHRVAVGIKDPARADDLLLPGLAIAAERHAELWVMHAWDIPSGYEGLVATPEEREQVARDATEKLEAALLRVSADGPEVEHTITIHHMNPARALVELSEEASLLVLARREHLLPRGHIGGVARAVLRHAACPVMVVPPRGMTPVPVPTAEQAAAYAASVS